MMMSQLVVSLQVLDALMGKLKNNHKLSQCPWETKLSSNSVECMVVANDPTVKVT